MDTPKRLRQRILQTPQVIGLRALRQVPDPSKVTVSSAEPAYLTSSLVSLSVRPTRITERGGAGEHFPDPVLDLDSPHLMAIRTC